ncbi:type-F conjugative transfer system protein TraW [Rickettsia argasii]|uniref:Type-F conjugative transfer system protein TraW n=1 Tax=Rickettsia argasii T170-B TaxID=1268837 RepID=A0A0F3RBN5_9RICK|nr:type-F conjugative transfer system protein TraW [Rickettsia argasii]KJW03850.1 type-F conjugative transfer system protein TraW [Rickettsia argasii T170-B]
MGRYLALKIIVISFFILFLAILQVSNVNADGVNKLGKSKSSKILDYGVRGHVFPIIEKSLLEIIMARLKIAKQNGILEKMQEEFKNKVQQKISRPTAILALAKTSINRNWHYDPSFIQKTDIKDQAGNIIVKAGTSVNPLEKISWGEPLIFIDGDDKQQIKWAKLQIGRLVLTKGNPIELRQELNKQVFFDQGGMLTTRFKIKAVPAIAWQEGKLLKISEIKIN